MNFPKFFIMLLIASLVNTSPVVGSSWFDEKLQKKGMELSDDEKNTIDALLKDVQKPKQRSFEDTRAYDVQPKNYATEEMSEEETPREIRELLAGAPTLDAYNPPAGVINSVSESVPAQVENNRRFELPDEREEAPEREIESLPQDENGALKAKSDPGRVGLSAKQWKILNESLNESRRKRWGKEEAPVKPKRTLLVRRAPERELERPLYEDVPEREFFQRTQVDEEDLERTRRAKKRKMLRRSLARKLLRMKKLKKRKKMQRLKKLRKLRAQRKRRRLASLGPSTLNDGQSVDRFFKKPQRSRPLGLRVRLLGGMNSTGAATAPALGVSSGVENQSSLSLGLGADFRRRYYGAELEGYYNIASTSSENNVAFKQFGTFFNVNGQLPFRLGKFGFIPKVGLGYGFLLQGAESQKGTATETLLHGPFAIVGLEIKPFRRFRVSADYAMSIGASGSLATGSGVAQLGQAQFDRARVGFLYDFTPRIGAGGQYVNRSFGYEGAVQEVQEQFLGMFQYKF